MLHEMHALNYASAVALVDLMERAGAIVAWYGKDTTAYSERWRVFWIY